MLRRLSTLLLALAGAVLFAQTADKPLVIVLVGPPASGKSTQAEYLKRKFKLPVVVVEDLIRAADGQPTMERSDPRVNALVRKAVEQIDTTRGFTLDGFPATRAQADYLASMLGEMDMPSPFVVQLRVPDEQVRERCLARGGPEDKPANIERRLTEYRREMDMIRGYYREADIWTIDGAREVRAVSQTILLLVQDR